MEESMSLMETLGWLGIIAIVFFVVAGIIATITTPKLTTNDISSDELNHYGIDTSSNNCFNGSFSRLGIDIQKKVFFEANLRHIKLDGVSKSYYKMKEMINLTDVIEVELIQDNDIVSKVSSSSAISRAVVGGALAGGIGAVIGGNTAKSKSLNKLSRISFKFKINDMDNPYKEILIFSDKKGLSKTEKEQAWKLFGQVELIISDLNKK
ncbi:MULTISPECIES: hypothetical protein [Enterococcus]|uniref:hypothetical protein n=1 Tax=Enterococcus TaxID=1350 RepID=UPI001158771E|nr:MULTISPECIES: hypothetical protein [Enterococcus]